MKTTLISAAALSTLLLLVGCDTDDRPADATDPTTSATSPSASSPSASSPSEDPAPSLSSLGDKDDLGRVDFPGSDVVFADSSSARSDGTTFSVTTAAEETVSIALPTESEGWIYDVSVDLGDAGTGYMVTQSGGEYINTFLVVLDDGELYLPESDDEVVFGQFAGEGPYFETFTTDGGAHLVTQVDDQGPSGETEFYAWSVEDRTLVPTLLS